MPAGNYKITIEQGATFNLNMTWKDSTGAPVDITGYTAAMQVREQKSSTNTLLSLSSAAGSIVLGDAAGTIAIEAAAADTGSINADNGYYDLELTAPSGEVTRLLEGRVEISKEVTR